MVGSLCIHEQNIYFVFISDRVMRFFATINYVFESQYQKTFSN